MKNPEAAAFIRDVMSRVGATNPSDLSKILGPPWTDRDQQRKLYKWRDGSQHPNGPSTIALIRAAGLLREDGAAVPAPSRPDPVGDRLAALETRMGELAAAADVQKGFEALQAAIDRLARSRTRGDGRTGSAG